MRAPHYVVDAFVFRPFSGNPAAVCLPREWPEAGVMRSIAAENNLSETAFCVPRPDGEFDLRWFTPTVEIDLCGHATLATAHVLATEPGAGGGHNAGAAEGVVFHTRSGRLTVERDDGGYAMNLPASEPAVGTSAPRMLAALGVDDAEVLCAGANFVAILADEADVRRLDPDFTALAAAGGDLVCVAAPAREYDFVVRVFAPNVGIDEDPATGSAQCILAPLWSKRLGREELSSFQASARGAVLRARSTGGGDRVIVGGRCTTFIRGELELPEGVGRS